MIRTRQIGTAALASLAALLVMMSATAATFADTSAAASTGVPQPPPCSPLPSSSDFVATIDNPYLPWITGMQQRYVGKSGGETQQDVVVVTHDTKVILGIAATVVHDNVYSHGQLVEKTDDWYAQDKNGNVWYMGEDSTVYPSGSKEGSWEAGVNGAQAGIIMEAHPRVGDFYSQECSPGVAQDTAQVIDLDATVTVVAGTYHHALVTREWSPLEPIVLEQKWYGQGVGTVKAQDVHGSNDASQLVFVLPGA